MDKCLRLVVSEDGSSTVYTDRHGEHYHSTHGAVQESRHIFVEAAWRWWTAHHPEQRTVRIFEVGLGTALNLLLIYNEVAGGAVQGVECHEADATASARQVHYTAIERYPLPRQIAEGLNYGGLMEGDDEVMRQIHCAPWGEAVALHRRMTMVKVEADLCGYTPEQGIDIVFFDAFSPDTQPELWSQQIFDRLYAAMNDGGVLTTYCVKGIVKQALRQAGFEIVRLAGPPGKRHILRATKPSPAVAE